MTVSLMYHDIAAPAQRDSVGFPGPLAARYKLAPEAFESHLDALGACGARPGVVAGGSLPPAALTFDDGGASALAAAAALERRGWRGHFFVTTGRIGSPGFLDVAGVRELSERGHVVGSHSHDHPAYMGRLTAEDVLLQWTRSRDVLAEALGDPPRIASVPGGHVSEAVIDGAARAGYEVLMTSDPTTRVRRRGGLLVLGRYGIWSTTPARQAARYVSGSPVARGRLWLEWKVKSASKDVSPELYERLRRVRAQLPALHSPPRP